MVHELGAKSIILISRSGMDAKGAADAVEALRRPDVVITVRKCDVADKESLSTVLRDCLQTLWPIRGVIQGAMVLKVCLEPIFPILGKPGLSAHANYTGFDFLQHDSHEILPSPRPQDTRLAKPTRFLPAVSKPTRFLRYALLSGRHLRQPIPMQLLPGNTFQDALAHHRISHGLPAFTIDVGKVVEVGWVAQNQETVARSFSSLARDICVRDLTNLIEHHLRTAGTDPGKAAAQTAIGIDKYTAFDARFSHVGASLASVSRKQDSQDLTRSLESQIAAVGRDSTRLVPIVLEAFKQKLGWLLALKVEDVREEDTIAAHGVDSLVAVEIRNWLRKETKANTSVFDILNGKVSLRGVVEGIVKEIVKD